MVAGAILFYYDRTNPKSNCASTETIPTINGGTIDANILGVVGAGVLASESVAIQNNGNTSLLLTGWMLKDGQGRVFVFPQLTLYPGGTVQVHSSTGQDSAADLYWQLTASAWKSGDLVALYDTKNIARAFYRVP